MSRFLSILFQMVARVVVSIVIGLRIEHKERLPTSGPAILVANHNSHLDTIVLMSLFPLSMVHRLRPVANIFCRSFQFPANQQQVILLLIVVPTAPFSKNVQVPSPKIRF
jgi:hypothetical protein